MVFGDLLANLVRRLGRPGTLVREPARTWDALYSVGDATKLRETTGWSPRLTLDQTVAEIIDAEAH